MTYGKFFPTLFLCASLALTGCTSSGGESNGSTTKEPQNDYLLIAADAEGIIYEVNPETAENSELGDSGVPKINSMAHDPDSGVIFAGTWDIYNNFDGSMHSLSATSYEASEFVLDNSETGDIGGNYTGLARVPEGGGILVVNETECSSLFEFDPDSGVISASTDAPSCYSYNNGGLPITFDPEGMLYLIENEDEDEEVFTVDLDSGESTLRGVFTFAGFPSGLGLSDLVHALATHPGNGTIYGAMTTGDLVVMDFSDPEAMTATYIGTMEAVLDGLTFVTIESETTAAAR